MSFEKSYNIPIFSFFPTPLWRLNACQMSRLMVFFFLCVLWTRLGSLPTTGCRKMGSLLWSSLCSHWLSARGREIRSNRGTHSSTNLSKIGSQISLQCTILHKPDCFLLFLLPPLGSTSEGHTGEILFKIWEHIKDRQQASFSKAEQSSD